MLPLFFSFIVSLGPTRAYGPVGETCMRRGGGGQGGGPKGHG